MTLHTALKTRTHRDREIQKGLTIKGVKYQRNGICGIGFYHVFFDFKEENEELCHFVGFVMPQDDSDECPSIYGVIEVNKPDTAWRGDHFVDDMWTACLEVRDALYLAIKAQK